MDRLEAFLLAVLVVGVGFCGWALFEGARGLDGPDFLRAVLALKGIR